MKVNQYENQAKKILDRKGSFPYFKLVAIFKFL